MRLQCTVPIALASALLALSAARGQTTSHTGGSRAGIDVLLYTFRVDFPASTAPPDTIRFAVTTVAVRTGAVSALALDLVATMQVDSVQLNAQRVPFTRPGDSVRVALPAGRGDTLQLIVFYHGRPLDGLIVRRDSSLGWTAFGDNFPDRARQWLAVIDHPSDKALVEWDVHAPATHRVIANGELLEETPDAGTGTPHMVRTRFRTLRPIYTAVMVIGVAPFAVLELGATACGLAETPGCVRQSVWVPPAQRAVIPGSFARAGEIVAFFSQVVGPFPYEKLAHVSSSTRYGGMENAGEIFYANALFKPGSPNESLIAHETAHQWFGDAVTEREWPHVWLSEGFATYFSALWTEHAHGVAAFRADMTRMRADVIKSTITTQRAVIDTTLNDVSRVLNTNVYQKAGFALHMLRAEIGDSAFFGGIRAYYAAHRHANALTSDLQAEFERTAGRPLDWFFDQWMRRPGVADVQAKWRWDPTQQRVIVTVVQGTATAPYRLSLAVDVTDATGAVTHHRVTIPAATTTTIAVPVPLPAAPRAVQFDADVSLLGTLRAP